MDPFQSLLASVKSMEGYLLEIKNKVAGHSDVQDCLQRGDMALERQNPGTRQADSSNRDFVPVHDARNCERIKQLRLFKHKTRVNEYKVVFQLVPDSSQLSELHKREFNREPIFIGHFLEYSDIKNQLIYYLRGQGMQVSRKRGNIIEIHSYENHSENAILRSMLSFLKNFELKTQDIAAVKEENN